MYIKDNRMMKEELIKLQHHGMEVEVECEECGKLLTIDEIDDIGDLCYKCNSDLLEDVRPMHPDRRF